MCQNKSRIYLAFINLIFLALGAAVIGLAAWGVKHVDEFKGVLSHGTIPTAEAAGALLIVVSGLGFFGAVLATHKFGRFLLGVYNIFVFLLIVLVLAAGGLTVVFANKVKGSKYVPVNESNSQVQKWINELYPKCCSGGAVLADCPFYDFVSHSDCATENTFFNAIKSFVSKHFTPIAGILFGAAALQFINSCIACTVMRRGRIAQKKAEEEERKKQGAGQHPVAAGYVAPAAHAGVASNPYNQPTVAQDHRY